MLFFACNFVKQVERISKESTILFKLCCEESSNNGSSSFEYYIKYIFIWRVGMFHPPGEVTRARYQVLQHVPLTSKGTLKDGTFEALQGSSAYRATHPAESQPSATPRGYLCSGTHVLVCTFFTSKWYSIFHSVYLLCTFHGLKNGLKNTQK